MCQGYLFMMISILPATAAELKEVSSLEGNRLHTIQGPGLLALPNHEDGDGSNEKNPEVIKYHLTLRE